MKHVYVGMSGGVDSSLTAALLLHQGYKVTGVFMKNWAQDLPGFKCPWREDLADAKRVAVQLGIPFKMYDFQTEYKQKVVDYMIAEYQAGRTPNPDIMCNQEVKFKLFLDTALQDGADMIATGHYARISDSGNSKFETLNSKQVQNANAQNSKQNPEGVILNSIQEPIDKPEQSESIPSKIQNPKSNFQLLQAVDTNKDQTYFLYRVTEKALSRTLFPLGEMTKPEVRKKAAELGLITAQKKDSVGICFVGEIGIKEFLQNFVTAEPGDIIDTSTDKVVGTHEGALFYTIGQRHGLGVGGGLPYYVVGKDMKKNLVYVSSDLNNPDIWRSEVELTDLHWINQPPENPENLFLRVRHRGPLIPVKSFEIEGKTCKVILNEEVRAIAPGQSGVFYRHEVCLGGGILV